MLRTETLFKGIPTFFRISITRPIIAAALRACDGLNTVADSLDEMEQFFGGTREVSRLGTECLLETLQEENLVAIYRTARAATPNLATASPTVAGKFTLCRISPFAPTCGSWNTIRPKAFFLCRCLHGSGSATSLQLRKFHRIAHPVLDVFFSVFLFQHQIVASSITH